MRRLPALLFAAGLMAAPLGAVAGPPPAAPPGTLDLATPRPRLGVAVVELTPELRRFFGAPADRGVLIGQVAPGSAAAAAGVAVGDVITAVGGRAVTSTDDVLAALATARKGDAVALAAIRGHQPLALTARMRSDPMPSAAPGWPRGVDAWLRSWLSPWARPGAVLPAPWDQPSWATPATPTPDT